MHSSILVVPEKKLSRFLRRKFTNKDIRHIRMASAYVSEGGLRKVQPFMESVLEQKGCVSLLHGIDFNVTTPNVIRMLAKLNLDYPRMKYRVHPQRQGQDVTSPFFHPKLYMAEQWRDLHTIVIGSSNLTGSGLDRNIEVNSIFEGRGEEKPIVACLKLYQQLLRSPNVIEPHSEFLSRYEELYEAIRKRRRDEVLDPELEIALNELLKNGQEPPDWHPRTQVDVIVQTMQDLRANGQREVTIQELYWAAKEKAQQLGKEYKWSTWKNSVRGRINTNELSSKGEKLFRRISKSSYELTEKGETWSGSR